MADTALECLQRSIDNLASAVATLTRTHGKVPVVARLGIDLEQLRLDVADARGLPSSDVPAGSPAQTIYVVNDEPYDPSMWGDDSDHEGVGGYHGSSR